MSSLIKIPYALFESNIPCGDQYTYVFYYCLNCLPPVSHRARDPHSLFSKAKLENIEAWGELASFNVPVSTLDSLSIDKKGLKNNVMVFVYLCYMAAKVKKFVLKPDIGEIAQNIGLRKTEVRQAINNLISIDAIVPIRYLSGYYSMIDLELETFDLI